ncbi:MAG: hypothetical protein ACRCZI_03170 [Cetobacterium sp.]
MILNKDVIITARKSEVDFLYPLHWRSMEWFRPPNYSDDDGYGNYRGFYRVMKSLSLLNLGSMFDRVKIMQNTNISLYDLQIQHTSHHDNSVITKKIMESPGLQEYHGTIITCSLIDASLLDELEGAEEVVLFTERVLCDISLISIVDSPND